MTEYYPDVFLEGGPSSDGPSSDGPSSDGSTPGRIPRQGRLALARQTVARIERRDRAVALAGPVLTTGFAAVDALLPRGGLAFGAMHEILGLAARRFAVGLLARRLGQTNAPAIWVMPAAARHSLYGPGLVSLGVDPGRVIIARYKTTQEGLWSLEEALKSGAFSMVLGEPEGVLSTIAARRLQLAAETGAALGLLLSERQIPIAAPGSATSRWHADFAPALVPTPTLIEENKIQRRLALTLDRHRGACGDPTLGATHWTVDIAG